MIKDVLVSISGLQTELGSDETVEVVSCGEYHFRNGKHFVIYEEVMDESSNHMDTKCLLKMSDKQIELLKKGDVDTHMIFEEGKTHLSRYTTEFGDLVVGTTTSSIEIKNTEDELLAELAYTLEINYQFVSECHLTMKVTPNAGASS